MPSATASPTAPPTTSLARIHPALHFEAELASVGIVDAAGKPVLVIRHAGQLPAIHAVKKRDDGRYIIEQRPLVPSPAQHGLLAGRWSAADVEAFIKDGTAPTFAQLLNQIRTELRRQIEFARPEAASLVALWIAGTYFHPLFGTFPRLNLTGPKRTGKSKLLQLIAAISFNGLHLVIPTAATIFRLVEPLRPTLCLDEMEKLDRDDKSTIEALINAGYKVGTTVPRVEGDRTREVVLYDAYAPIALAGISGLNAVLADRAITVEMQRGLNKATINSEVVVDDPIYGKLRAAGYRVALARWLDVQAALETVRDRQDSFTTLAGRPLELYRPLIALAILTNYIGGDPRFLADLSSLVQNEAGSRDELDRQATWLFNELDRRLTGDTSITVTPAELLTGGDWTNRPLIDAARVGKLLNTYGFTDGRRRTSKGSVYTITRARFTEQAQRYGHQTDDSSVG